MFSRCRHMFILLHAWKASITAHDVPLLGVPWTRCPCSVTLQLRNGEFSVVSIPLLPSSSLIERSASALICFDLEDIILENLPTLRISPLSSILGIPKPPSFIAICAYSFGIGVLPISFWINPLINESKDARSVILHCEFVMM